MRLTAVLRPFTGPISRCFPISATCTPATCPGMNRIINGRRISQRQTAKGRALFLHVDCDRAISNETHVVYSLRFTSVSRILESS
jgi:hypothetical protein